MPVTANVPAFLHFPIAQDPTADYKTGWRAFGSSRSGGTRKHAGVDLYSPIGTGVHAMVAGKVTRACYYFYSNTYAIEVDHGTFLARYGEIKKDVAENFVEGDCVTGGQLLGYIGDLGLNISMLHLEIYTGAEEGLLTDRSNSPYQRRADLTDPTPFIDRAMECKSMSWGTCGPFSHTRGHERCLFDIMHW